MGRKKRSTGTEKKNLSNSDKKLEKLYIEALRNAKEGRLRPVVEATENPVDNDVGNNKTKKHNKRPGQILEEAIKKHQEQRTPQRRTFSVPVSRLVPFKNETSKGFQFPRDFKKDDVSLTWVPRADTASSCGITEYDRTLWGEFSNEECAIADWTSGSRSSTSTDIRDDRVEDILHILPLRSPEEDGASTPTPEHKTNSHLPPIYRTSLWRETFIRCHDNRGSIPTRGERWKDRGSVPLTVGKEELHIRTSLRKRIMSLAEIRRTKMEGNRRRGLNLATSGI